MMRKIILITFSCFFLLNCNEDYLEKEPLSEVTPNNFFKKSSDLELYTNSFYRMFPSTEIYSGDYHSDNIVGNTISDLVNGTRTTPTTGGGWNWEYLRSINFFLDNYEKVDDANAKKHYSGVAKFFRAYFYFDKVKRFGDVPYYDKIIEPNDEEALSKTRDNRTFVIDKTLEDLDYAIDNMDDDLKVYRVTKWTALALKSRIALYEGTWMKYRGKSGYEKYLEIAYKAAEDLMNNSPYSVYSTGNPDMDYLNLFASHNAISDEIILAREFNTELNVDHNVNYYTVTSSYGQPSMPKDMVNSYLMKDGTRFTDKSDYNKIEYFDETQNRDPRLSQTIRTPGYTRIGSSIVEATNFAAATTGYQLIKYVTESKYDTNDESITDLPLFRFAEVLLNYAEAKAELGILTQEDLNKSINLLRDRVNMPSLNFNEANNNPDNFLANQYVNVSNNNKGVILEIRRERRIELYMENLRWDDIVRWKEGQKLTQTFQGMYLPRLGKYDLDHNGSIDIEIYEDKPSSNTQGVVYLKLNDDISFHSNNLVDPLPDYHNRIFNESRDYLFPIPLLELQLNPNLTQNPGW
ncbi:MAG: RagB/SusD family nutrient uptake outer membrane protein [Weeksellaceae bacterium]